MNLEKQKSYSMRSIRSDQYKIMGFEPFTASHGIDLLKLFNLLTLSRNDLRNIGFTRERVSVL
jgi:hypothetical protein